MIMMTSIITFSQKSIKIQVAFIPDHKYNLETKNLTKMIMDAKVDDATREQMKSQGMSFPLAMDVDQNMTLLMSTGKFNEKKEVPIIMEYTNFSVSQKMGEMQLPSQGNPIKGFKATGWGDSKGKFRIDNVEGQGVTEDIKKMMTSLADQSGMYIAFPEKALKVGDEFVHEIPFNMPIQGGSTMKMIIKTVYKLTSFDANHAWFDTVITMTMDVTMEGSEMSAQGSGTGKMAFDLKKNFMSDCTSNIDMTMKMKMGPTDMDIKSSSKAEVKVTHP